MNSLKNLRLIALMAGVALSACSTEVEFAGNSADQRRPEVILDQEFAAATFADATVSFNPAFGLVEQRFALKEKDPRKAVLQQAERPLFTDGFEQGHDGDSSDEEYEVTQAGVLDLLVVVDDSGSMIEEQKNLSTKLASLKKFIDKTDWQIAVVTTTTSCLRNNRVIKKSDLDAEKAFKEAVEAGIDGSGEEKGIYQALRALKGECETGPQPWVRPNSSLAVLFLSDEDSYCPTSSCTGGYGSNDLLSYMKLIRPANASGVFDKLRAYALVWERSDSKCSNINGETDGLRYKQVVSALGGISGSICQEDYTQTLEAISRDVARIITYEYDLKFPPESDTLKITIDGVEYSDFSVAGKKLRLNAVSGSELKMRVTYRYGAKERFEDVTLSGDPDPKSLQVTINNNRISPSAYSYDEVSRVVQFVEMPPDKSNVKINWRQNIPLPKIFDVKNLGLRNAPVGIEVDGKPAGAYAYDEATGVIEFAEAPSDAAEIKVAYRTDDDRITDYPMSGVNFSSLKTWDLSDALSGEVLAAGIDNGVLMIASADDVVDGREVLLRLNYGDRSDRLAMDLPSLPVEGSVSVKALSGDMDCARNIQIDGVHVSFNCEADALDHVVIGYRYVAQSLQDFTVTGDVSGNTQWQVYVDGAAIKDYRRDGMTVSIPAELLHPTSKVRIIVTRVFTTPRGTP